MAGTNFTTDPSKPLELKIGKDGIEATEPITVGEAFRRTVKQHGDTNALACKEDGQWKKITFKEYYGLSIRAAKSFKKVIIIIITNASTLCQLNAQCDYCFFL